LALTSATTRSDVLDNLRLASVLKQHLQLERARLRQQFIESCDRWRHMRDLVAMHHKLYVATQSSFVMVKPMTVAECDVVFQSAIEMEKVFLANEKHAQFNRVICGCNAHLSVENCELSFGVKKTYHNSSAEFVGNAMWRLCSNPEIMRSIFSPSLEMQIRVIQQVDSDNIVMLQEYVEVRATGERINVKTLCLLARRWTKRGYLQVIRAIDSERLEFLGLHPASTGDEIVWNDQNSWYDPIASEYVIASHLV
jgi:hypothetical protein